MPDLHDFGGSMNNVLLQSSFDDRLKSDEGFLSATGDLCTLTAGSGKDLYLTGAKVVFYMNANLGISVGDKIELKVNGVVVETAAASMSLIAPAVGAGDAGAGSSTVIYKFENLFHRVEQSEILKLEVIKLDSETDVEGFIQAIEVPAGENPLTYTGE